MVATQILESMVENPTPARAEAVDIYEAVGLGVDALVLAGETSIGRYPIEAVKWLKKIVSSAEGFVKPPLPRLCRTLKESFAKGVVELAEGLKAKLLIYSMKDTTAKLISAQRPMIQTIVGVPKVEVARSLKILWGIEVRVLEAGSYEEGLEKLFKALSEEEVLGHGDIALLTYGLEGLERSIRLKRVGAA